MKLPSDVKAALNAGLPLVISIILFVVVGNLGIANITDLRTQITQAQKDQQVLNQKVNILQTEAATLGTSSVAVSTALPDSNTVLAVISQLKSISTNDTLALTNLKTGGQVQDSSGLSRVDVSFEVSGTRDQIITFLGQLANAAPIMVVSSIRFSENGGASRADVTVKSFWAGLPTNLPTTTEALTDLTPDEQAVLDSVGQLTQPPFTTLPASPTSGKTNPFTQ